MVETIQAFVEKIRTEGVQAGQKEAESLLAQAKQQADEILSQAQQEREKILAQAKAEAESTLSRAQTELNLAARDAAMRLRDALGRALRNVLACGAEAKLTDPKFVGDVLHEIVTQYGKLDIEGKRAVRINVPEQMRQKLVDWAMTHIGQANNGEHMGIDLQGTLSQAGFEYNATGATVEVTVESVVEVLSDLVSPKLREVIERAMARESK